MITKAEWNVIKVRLEHCIKEIDSINNGEYLTARIEEVTEEIIVVQLRNALRDVTGLNWLGYKMGVDISEEKQRWFCGACSKGFEDKESAKNCDCK